MQVHLLPRRELMAAGGLLLLAFAVFSPSLWFGFVNWDDYAYVTGNPLISGWSVSNLRGICTDVVCRNFAPLTIFSFLLDHTLWGLNPTGYHLTNVLLHLLNGFVVWLLVRQVTGSPAVALLTCALFLVHPVQVESVVWVSSRKSLLTSLFMLLALLVRLRPSPTSRDDAWYAVLLLLALLSKAHAVVVPAMVLTWDLVMRRQKLSEALPRQVIPGTLSLLFLLLTMGAQNTVMGGVRGHMGLSTLQILAVDVTILWRYVGMLVWPSGLSVMYDPPTTGIAFQVMAGGTAWMVAVWLLYKARRTQPLWVCGAIQTLLLLFPMLNIFRITTLMNDRYLYLPSIVLFAMFAGLVVRLSAAIHASGLFRTRLPGAVVCPGIPAMVVTGMLLTTLNHQHVWRDPESLWQNALRHHPDLPILRIQLALSRRDDGRVEEAIRILRQTLVDCKPDPGDRERMEQYLQEWQTVRNPTARNSNADVQRQ